MFWLPCSVLKCYEVKEHCFSFDKMKYFDNKKKAPLTLKVIAFIQQQEEKNHITIPHVIKILFPVMLSDTAFPANFFHPF